MSCTTGTLLALNWMMLGGVMPGGMKRRMVEQTADTWAMLGPMSVPGWKYTRSSATPWMLCDSIRWMPLTVVDMARSVRDVTRRSISSGARPL